MRIKPSPHVPNALPGMQTTFSSSRSRLQNSALVSPNDDTWKSSPSRSLPPHSRMRLSPLRLNLCRLQMEQNWNNGLAGRMVWHRSWTLWKCSSRIKSKGPERSRPRQAQRLWYAPSMSNVINFAHKMPDNATNGHSAQGSGRFSWVRKGATFVVPVLNTLHSQGR